MSRISCAVVLALSLASPAQAATRWTAPGASGPEPCLESNPCSIADAIEKAPNPGDEVIVKPGDYAITAIDVAKSLDIHGQDGQPRPRLVGPHIKGLLTATASPPTTMRIRRLYIENTGSGGPLFAVDGPAELSDLILVASQQALGLAGYREIAVRDTVARTTGSDAIALNSGVETAELRNVTAIGPGANSTGIRVAGFCSGDCMPGSHASTLTAKNVIARGTAFDVSAHGPDPGYPGTLNVSYSNYRTIQTGGLAGFVNDRGNNQSAAPLLANEAAGDYHQLAGSPTIDAGVADSLVGSTDFDGDFRALGAAPDIGADEFVPPVAAAIPDGTRPLIFRLAMDPSTFAAFNRGASVLRAASRGTRVSYRVSEDATARFTVERAARGRRVGRRCAAPNRRNRKRRRCTRYRRLRGSFSHRGKTGTNRFRFSGRLRGRKLRPGRYRLVMVATDAAGNRSAARRSRFRIVRR